MYIRTIKGFYFRAFGDTPAIRFGEGLTIFYGANATGKSSLAEAIEWLLYGTTRRREKGESYSKEEYRGSYLNFGRSSNEIPFVEMEVEMLDGTRHLIRRTILLPTSGRLTDTKSILEIDGNNALGFAQLGITFTSAHNPVIVQHGIQDFIHTRPIDQYRAVSEAIGLAQLVNFKDVLERAKNRYKNDPPSEVLEAKQRVRSLITQIKADPKLSSLARRWANGEFNETRDSGEIFAIAREEVGIAEGGAEILITELRKRHEESLNRIFDLSPFRLSPNFGQIRIDLSEHTEHFRQAVVSLCEACQALATVIAGVYTRAQVSFWKTGLDLIPSKPVSPEKPVLCPFCEEETITPASISKLQGRIAKTADYENNQKAIEARVTDCLKKLKASEDLCRKLAVKELEQGDLTRLALLLGDDSPELIDFIKHNNELTSELEQVLKKLKEMQEDIGDIPQMIEEVTKVEQVIQHAGQCPELMKQITQALQTKLVPYQKAFAKLESSLRQRLSSEGEVAHFANLIELLQQWPSIETVAISKQLEDELLECQRIAGAYILEKQREVLESKGQEMVDWYSLLSPNTDVCFSGIEPSLDRITFKASRFGHEMKAVPNLSQSQLNCLGLSIYMSSVVDVASPFRFIIFDDPVQAMDDEHCESFILSVVPKLLDSGFQVVVMTHLKPVADRLRNTNYHRNPLYYRFDKLKPEGPVIEPYVLLKEEFKKVRTLAAGSEGDRVLAVDRIRVLCEHIIREAHLHLTGTEVPPQYATANASQLFPLFVRLPVKQSFRTGLKDSIDWSDPAHHTDTGWQVPSQAGIQPHIDRLHNIAKELGLQLR